MPDSHVHPDTRKKLSKAEERLAEVVTRLSRLYVRMLENRRFYAKRAHYRNELQEIILYAEHGK